MAFDGFLLGDWNRKGQTSLTSVSLIEGGYTRRLMPSPPFFSSAVRKSVPRTPTSYTERELVRRGATVRLPYASRGCVPQRGFSFPLCRWPSLFLRTTEPGVLVDIKLTGVSHAATVAETTVRDAITTWCG